MGETKENIEEQKKAGVKFSLKGLVSGDLFSKGFVTKNLSFLLFAAMLMVLYIGYGYYVNNTIRKIAKEERVEGNLYSELQSLMELYDQESLRSKVAKEIEGENLYEVKDPPRVVEVEKEFYKESGE